MKKKWDYDSCFELAKNCNSRGEFKIANYQAYHIARKNGWLDDYDWFIVKYKPSGFWTQENCYDEAKKYLGELGLAYESIHVCKNNCVLFRKSTLFDKDYSNLW